MKKVIPLSETEKLALRIIRNQQKKGRKRYGVAMSFMQSKNPVDWVNEALEECADMLQYLTAMKLCVEQYMKEKGAST